MLKLFETHLERIECERGSLLHVVLVADNAAENDADQDGQ